MSSVRRGGKNIRLSVRIWHLLRRRLYREACGRGQTAQASGLYSLAIGRLGSSPHPNPPPQGEGAVPLKRRPFKARQHRPCISRLSPPSPSGGRGPEVEGELPSLECVLMGCLLWHDPCTLLCHAGDPPTPTSNVRRSFNDSPRPAFMFSKRLASAPRLSKL